jgi:hypothetical protein
VLCVERFRMRVCVCGLRWRGIRSTLDHGRDQAMRKVGTYGALFYWVYAREAVAIGIQGLCVQAIIGCLGLIHSGGQSRIVSRSMPTRLGCRYV